MSSCYCIIIMHNFEHPARVYAAYETGTSDQINTICRVCGKVAENLAHVLAGCLSLAQTK